MEETQGRAIEFPPELRDRLKLSEHDVKALSDYMTETVREQMREEFYQDVGRGVFRVGWKLVGVAALYLAWKGSGGPGGWVDMMVKFLRG